MIRPVSAMLLAALLLSGCGFRDSVLNPFNWFGRSAPEATTAQQSGNALIPRRRGLRREVVYTGRPIAQISDVTVERLPGGAIVRATGISDYLGPYEARLTPEPDAADSATINYSFDVVLPPRAQRGGSDLVRSVTVATYLSDKELEGIRTIRVRGQRNAQVSRRR